MDIWITSLYGYHNQEPLVNFAIGGDRGFQMSPEEARKIARDLMEAAESAEQDGFIIEFLTGVVKTDEVRAAHVLNDFRKWKDERRKSN